ncbi:hypothetical protein BaRGS_00030280, partial [Batillaria attramentaria]
MTTSCCERGYMVEIRVEYLRAENPVLRFRTTVTQFLGSSCAPAGIQLVTGLPRGARRLSPVIFLIFAISAPLADGISKATAGWLPAPASIQSYPSTSHHCFDFGRLSQKGVL